MVLSAANADVSHLNGQNGYHYSNLGLTSELKLHSADGVPAPTQYHATYGDGRLPNSYVPPPSGSPWNSVAPLPAVHTPSPLTPLSPPAPPAPSSPLTPPAPPSTRLSVPLQSPLTAGQKFTSNLQQLPQPRAYQPQAYQRQAYQPQNYQTQNYQTQNRQTQNHQAQVPQPTFQTQGFATNTFNNGFAQSQTAQTQTQTQAQAQTQTQAQVQTQTQSQLTNSQEPIVTKHYYVHAAPEEPEEDAGPRLVQIG